ncbi:MULTISPECIES: YjiH family protein [Halorussus]|uniref:YjiH family protein n=1 Tax=Halorussus TaxID=1070314 RepID=UPI0020A118F8|nr:nucleoside recognition domain-containing protein [Halorussus vallis]USZ77810.1 YjiH family protein [Halorussus vallis]
MFDKQLWQSPDQETWTPGEELEDVTTINDVDPTEFELLPGIRFLIAFGLGVFFFLVPVTWNGQVTVPFDVVASAITAAFPTLVGVVGLLMITAGAGLSIVTELHRRDLLSLDEETAERLDVGYWETSPLFLLLRVAAIPIGVVLFLELGPSVLHQPTVGGLVWGTILLSVVVIIPLGAVFVNLLVELGGLEFIGTLARPFMRPLFRLPGRAALDSIASWIGAFTVGYYVTYNVFHRGGYHKRDVFVIATCFAPVSIGFVGVIVSTLGLLEIFPIILLGWLIAIVVTGAVLVRIPPLSNVPTEYVTEPSPEAAFSGSPVDYLQFAISEAMEEAKDGRILPTAAQGLVDGFKVTAVILGTVLTISTATLLLIATTDVFQVIATPIAPVIAAFGIPDAQLVASAILISGIEQVSAAAVVANADATARLFVAIVAISQIIFFAASAPMMMDMFNDVPIRFRDTVVLFLLRTAILVPIAAAFVHAVNWLGYLP